MKLKIALLGAVAIGVLAFILIQTKSNAGQEEKVEPIEGRLQWSIQQAKKDGRKEVFIPAPTTDYAGTEDSNVDEILSSYTTVIADEIESKTYERDSNNLITWIKFKVAEPISGIRPPLCPGCNSSIPPADMLPLESGQFLISKSGGSLVIDGIRLTQVDNNFPPFERGQKYLMFISLHSSGIAVTLGGPTGVFLIRNDDELLPLNQQPHSLKQGVADRFKSSLKEIRNRIQQSH